MITSSEEHTSVGLPQSEGPCRVSDPKKIPAGVLCLDSSAITAGVDGCFLASRPGSGRSLRWDGPAHRAEHHHSGNVDHFGGTSAEAQRWVPSSTRVVDLPVYLSASLTRLRPSIGRTRSPTASRRDLSVRGRAVLRQLGFTPMLLGLTAALGHCGATAD